MFEFIKKMFKRERPARDPRVDYVEVDRVSIKKFEPKEFKPKRYINGRVENIWRYRYTDTNEIVEKPASEALDEIMRSTRPILLMGIVE